MTVEIPLWGLILAIIGIVGSFIAAWIVVKIDIGKLQERMEDVEEQHKKIPHIWKTINDVKVDIGKMGVKIDGLKHDRRNDRDSLDQLLESIGKIEIKIAKL